MIARLHPTDQFSWYLAHQWSSESDHLALGVCRDALRTMGIELKTASAANAPDAVKMHGMEVVNAASEKLLVLADLNQVASEQIWAQRLPNFVKRFMCHQPLWHGIPVGIHRANMAWVNAPLAQSIGTPHPSSFSELVSWLMAAKDRVPYPLAVGGEPWQIGVLFESVLLSVAGPDFYRRAIVQLEPQALASAEMVKVLDSMLVLRRFVDDSCWGLDWFAQLARVNSADAAIQVMGDWARASGCTDILPWTLPGTEEYFISIVDFFAPVQRSSEELTHAVATTLTQPGFQKVFAQIKGCMPAVRNAWMDVDPTRAKLLDDEGCVLPSLTFDQTCSLRNKAVFLTIIAEHFINREASPEIARSLAHEFAAGKLHETT